MRLLLLGALLLIGCGATQTLRTDQTSFCPREVAFFAEGSGVVFTIDEAHRLHTIDTLQETTSTLLPFNESPIQLAASPSETCMLTQAGTVLCWGKPDGRYVPYSERVCPWHSSVPQLVMRGARSLGEYHGRFCALSEQNELMCWGWASTNRPLPYSCAPQLIVGTEGVECGDFSQSGELCWRTPLGVTCSLPDEDPTNYSGFDSTQIAAIYSGGCACVTAPNPSLRCCSQQGECQTTPVVECPSDIVNVEDSDAEASFALLSSGPIPLPLGPYSGRILVSLEDAVRGLHTCVVEREPLQVRCNHDERSDIVINREGEVSFLAR